jgi:hypothetical protein
MFSVSGYCFIENALDGNLKNVLDGNIWPNQIWFGYYGEDDP